MPKTNIIFWGTSEFALPSLKKLIQENYQIKAVVTAPDKPAGRQQIPVPSPVKKFAQEKQLAVFQPEKPIQLAPQLKKISPDLNILAAYGRIIPEQIISMPIYGSINLHPSLLPKYRGPSPIQTAILENQTKTGVSLILMDEKIDHGPILAQAELPIANQDNYQTLSEKLSRLAAELLSQALPDYLTGRIKPKKQNESKAVYTKIITRQDGKIDLARETARQIHAKLRAFGAWPGIWTIINRKRVKILKAEPSQKPGPAALKTKQGYLVLELVQPEGKKPITGQEFSQGYLR